MSSPKKELPEAGKQAGFVTESEDERLRRDIYRPDMEKFRLFTQMLRNNKIYNRIKVTHK